MNDEKLFRLKQLATLEALQMLGYKYLVKDKDFYGEIGWTIACKEKPTYDNGMWRIEQESEKMNDILVLEDDLLFKDLETSNVHSIHKLLLNK